MKIIEVTQGSPEWLAHRAAHFNASDAPAMMGVSPYKTRNELLREMATGVAPEVDEATQGRFNDGHAAEALARPLAEEIIGEELYPVTGAEGEYSASFDGLTIGEDIAFEHKSLNDQIRICKEAVDLPPMYQVQMEQQLMVSGAGKCLFMASKWNPDGTLVEEKHFWYEPDMALRGRIGQGWIQFKRDLAAYTPPEVIPVAVAAPVMALPAVSIKVEGAVALISNLDVFGAGLKAFIARLPEKPSTDQEFADCKAACKTLQEAQDALDAAEAHAMGQVSSFDEMRRTKALYFDLARTTRLAVEKMVAAREQQIKVEIVQKAKTTYDEHVASLTKETGGAWIVLAPPDFAGAIKGKRTIASIQDAVDTTLANGKIVADASAKRIRENLACIKADGVGYEFLFSDSLALISKPIDDLRMLVKVRISDHKAAEQKKQDELRKKIQEEEQAKAEAKAKEHAAAQEQMPDTERSIVAGMGNQPARELVNAGNERPSGGLSLNSPAPAAAPASIIPDQRTTETRSLIDKALSTMSLSELDEALDAINAIRSRRQRKTA